MNGNGNYQLSINNEKEFEMKILNSNNSNTGFMSSVFARAIVLSFVTSLVTSYVAAAELNHENADILPPQSCDIDPDGLDCYGRDGEYYDELGRVWFFGVLVDDYSNLDEQSVDDILSWLDSWTDTPVELRLEECVHSYGPITVDVCDTCVEISWGPISFGNCSTSPNDLSDGQGDSDEDSDDSDRGGRNRR